MVEYLKVEEKAMRNEAGNATQLVLCSQEKVSEKSRGDASSSGTASKQYTTAKVSVSVGFGQAASHS